jgi:ketosteroid isomerase-like protein
MLAALLFSGCVQTAAKPAAIDKEALKAQVAATERAFAKTMADRDYAAFTSFLADDTIFFASAGQQHGKAEVAETWKRFFTKPDAPFSWSPDQIEVLDSGTLAWSSGPVFDPEGTRVATFNSVWRLEAPGIWRIVFDKGNDVCRCLAGN